MVTANQNTDEIAWYENDGSGNFIATHSITTAIDGPMSVYVEDVDGDGDLDVLSASNTDTQVAWYQNDGAGNFTMHSITTSASGVTGVAATDLDGDGDVDVLASANGTLYWYENDGSENFTTRIVAGGASAARMITFADVNQDGHMDVLTASYGDDTIAWYENDGSENFTERQVTTSADGARYVQAIDLDSDGDIDLVGSSGLNDEVFWFENDGSESFSKHLISSAYGDVWALQATDLDLDGDVDIAFVDFAGPSDIVWLENDGSEGFSVNTIATGAGNPNAIALGDLDGDGDEDLLSTSWSGGDINWFENYARQTTLDGNPTFVEGGPAVVLDNDVVVSDAELDSLNGGLGNYDGASLTIVRNGGSNSEDVLSFSDGSGISLSGGNLLKNAQAIATFDTTTTVGQLVITFTDAGGEIPTSADVDNILRQITYANSSDTPPASVQIDWTFDDGNTGSQGSGGSLQAIGSTTVDITAVNDAPLVAANTGMTVNEGSAGNTITNLMLNEGDVDDAGAGLTFTVTSVTGNGTLRNNGTALGLNDTFTQADIDAGLITYDHDDSETTTDSFDFSLADGGEDGATPATGTFNISINPVNDHSVTAISDGDGTADAVSENATIGTIAGVTAFADDADAGDSVTYSLDDNDGGRFAINTTTGVVTVAGAIDREADGATRSITVRATSSDSSSTTQIFVISITDVDEFDVGSVTDTDGTANAVNENATVGTVVGITASASDADATTNGITYSLQDNDGGRFAINSSTGVVTVAGAIDREADGASRNITVRATSADGSFTDQVFAVAINDLDEFDVGAVSDVDATANAVDENATVGTVVGITASASDADATDNTITYTLQDNDGGRFAINSSTGVVTVAGAIDREADGASRNITVRATSADGSFTDQVLAIAINDLDEFDVGALSDVDATANAVDENATVGTVVGITASASDPDATTNAITYSLQDNDGGRFAINSSTGVVTVAGAIDREADGASRNITVRATSADGSFTDQVLAITINDLDEFDVGAVSDVDATANAVDENATVGTVVGITASASDRRCDRQYNHLFAAGQRWRALRDQLQHRCGYGSRRD